MLFLDAFVKLQKSDYKLHHVCLPVRLSLRMEQLVSNWTDFHEMWYLSVFQKCREDASIFEIWQEQRVLYMKMMIWRMCSECWTPKATKSHSEFVLLFFPHWNNGCKNASQCYVTRWFKYDRDWFNFIYNTICPGHIWTLPVFISIIFTENIFHSNIYWASYGQNTLENSCKLSVLYVEFNQIVTFKLFQ
jgi:hypothetical protein